MIYVSQGRGRQLADTSSGNKTTEILTMAQTAINSAVSNHKSTAGILQIRGVTQEEVPQKNPFPFQDNWRSLEEEFPAVPGMNLLPFNVALERFLPVMEATYGNDESFDRRLFSTLLTSFNTYVKYEKTDKYFILDVGRENCKYAVGVARKVDCTRDVFNDRTKSTSSGLSAPCEIDHGSCIFERKGDNWEVTDIFSLVELKTSASSCKKFTVEHDMVTVVDVESRHGAVGQAVLYTMGCVLQYHARNGVLRNAARNRRELPNKKKKLPFAVIAGIDSAAGVNEWLRWVWGHLICPRVCGNEFKYCVNNFGKFSNKQDEEMESILNALSVYVHTILYGLRVALRVLRDRMENQPYQPDPLSGRNLMIGVQHLHWPVFASPIKLPSWVTDPSGYLKIAQGELFRGCLNVHEVLANSNLEAGSFIEFGVNDETIGVLVKVSSKAVHNWLISPSAAFSAMYGVKAILRGPLLATIEMDAGVISIMRDLSMDNYSMLCPRDHRGNLALLWEGFADLVRAVLLPLAQCGVVHSDIRPGFNVTSNIMCKLVGNKFQMELIDFESLVRLKNWTAPPIHRGYIQKTSEWNANTFVWWQCVATAFAWFEERNVYQSGSSLPDQADVRFFQVALLRYGTKPDWMPRSLHPLIKKAKIDQGLVIKTLEALGRVFSERDVAMVE